MPFTKLLEDLVSSVKGATGALILEADGEAVQWYSRADGERLKLRGAYLVNLLPSCRAATSRLHLGAPGHLIVNYDGASFVIQELSLDYYLLIEMDPLAGVASAVHRLKQALPEARRALET